MIPSPEIAAKIATLRAKIAAGGKLTEGEMREAIAFMRQGRASAQAASTGAKRAKARKAVPSASELLDGFDDEE